MNEIFVHVSKINDELFFTLPSCGYDETIEIEPSKWTKFKDVIGELPLPKDVYPKSSPSTEYVLLNGVIYKKNKL